MDILCLVKDFFLFNATEILTTGYWLRALKRPMKPRPEFLLYTYVQKVQFYKSSIQSFGQAFLIMIRLRLQFKLLVMSGCQIKAECSLQLQHGWAEVVAW